MQAGKTENTTENAAERAYRELRQAVLEGRLPKDRKITETGLAESLGISRTPIREAVKRLLLEGLLERRKGQGIRCALPDAAEIQEVFELRLRLESFAASRAAIRATQDQIDALTQSAETMSRLARTDPANDAVITRIDRENARFHALILEATQSQRLAQLVKFSTDISLVSRTFRRFTAEQRRRSAAHHVEIAAAIAARSPRWAENMMQAHILSAADIFEIPLDGQATARRGEQD
ncbi:DNA-binding transcriptional regulator, GntR family [Paracoccus isoporae]|uniref:DNA-binding transcriptional regulator, GntR family n=1 Tax=Paracoccus isoporae TaxID=591205 RepID=A0A1G6ZM85_9RHOB|nr:GntR family transcriptional regulator [Paracoccus isoporae]SDE03523.1 DNA-binding transcriptional regulator, GntR family [Paracoccus isoporae]